MTGQYRAKSTAALLIVGSMLLLAQLACIPPQDCELISKTVAGRVDAADGNPIEGATISVGNQFENDPGYEQGKVDLTLSTDADGQFKATVWIFRCDSLSISASKDKFAKKEVVYRADTGLSDSIPAEVVITLEKSNSTMRN